jgi:PHD/YefM family antitoxin component YafN of YafNO toxin-antitoxin module
MKVVTFEELETNFDSIMEDVELNKEFYMIQAESGNVMLIPYDQYEVLKDTYQDWVEDTSNELTLGFDPFPLPVEYINDAEPKI